MSAEKRCADCKATAMEENQPHSNRPICRPCYLAHLKRLLALYSHDGLESQRATILSAIRKIEEAQ